MQMQMHRLALYVYTKYDINTKISYAANIIFISTAEVQHNSIQIWVLSKIYHHHVWRYYFDSECYHLYIKIVFCVHIRLLSGKLMFHADLSLWLNTTSI